MRHFTVARKAFYFFVHGMRCMKLHTVRLMFFAEAMAIQTCGLGHLAGSYNLFLVARFFTVHVIGNKFGVVNGYKSAPDDLVRYLVTIPAVCLNQALIRSTFSEKMTGVTSIVVHAEVFVAFEMAMTRVASDGDPINRFFNVIGVGELDAIIVDRF